MVPFTTFDKAIVGAIVAILGAIATAFTGSSVAKVAEIIAAGLVALVGVWATENAPAKIVGTTVAVPTVITGVTGVVDTAVVDTTGMVAGILPPAVTPLPPTEDFGK